MKKIVVYEYDKLTLAHEHMDEKKLDALLKFNEFHNYKYFNGITKGIRFKHYVGLIQVDGLSIEVLPKVDRFDDKDKWRDVLIYMLKSTRKLKVQSTGPAFVKKQNLNLLEIYFEIYLKEIQNLQREGLIKKYRKQTSNTSALKGKLEFAGNIQRNLIHKERFYTTHHVYDHDHKLHQVLNEALVVVEHFTNGTKLSDLCRRVHLNFPEVKNIQINESVLSGIKLNRKTEPYANALNIARLILLNYSPDIKSGKQRMLSLLFDMNQLWEEYVLAMLRIKCRDEGNRILVRGQETKPFWSSRRIKPDIVIKTDKDVFVIDTKWKQPPNNGASVNDIRQMYAYSRYWKSTKAMLLYPGQPINMKFEDYKNNLHDGMEHQCKIAKASVIDSEGNPNKNIAEDILKELEIEL
ncbi:McrC family protein [Crocinitomicaceae bacterium]|nr:McrC family protein [Crocinitomicaceae bacterium]